LNPTIESLAKVVSGAKMEVNSIIVLQPKADHYPLSHAQRRLWVLNQLGEEDGSFNIPMMYTITGAIDRTTFEQVLQTIVERHEILRTTFVEVDDDPMQRVADASAAKINVSYHEWVDRNYSQEEIKLLCQHDVVAKFDLANGPLWTAKLIRMKDSSHVFILNMHHIISDAWSMKILANEFMVLYNAYTERLPNPLPPLRVQYKDYSGWQRQLLEDTEERLRQKEYWKHQFVGVNDAMDFPLDFERPDSKTYRGSAVKVDLGDELTNRLRAFGKAYGFTPFNIMMAAVKTLLYRYCGQADIVVGTTVAGREHTDLENQVGFYVNTVPIRSTVDGENSFNTLLQEVRKTLVESFKHQTYPFDCILEDLNIQRRPNRSPLFDVLVEYVNIDTYDIVDIDTYDQTPHSDAIQFEPMEVELPVSQYDLLFRFYNDKGKIRLNVEYSTDLFREDSVTLIGSRLLEIFDSMIGNPESKIGYDVDTTTALAAGEYDQQHFAKADSVAGHS
jgi:NRPS condensation-like uncharacterized protein